MATVAERVDNERDHATGALGARGPGKRRWRSSLLTIYFWLVLTYTIVPILVMIAYSFNDTPRGRLTFAWNGLTLQWYEELFVITDLTNALVNSLVIALTSMVIAVVLGTPLALAMSRYRYWGKGFLEVTIFTDIAAPSVVVGASLLGLFVTLAFPLGGLSVLIAHVAFNVAFVVVVIRARLAGIDRSLEEAAQDLFATPSRTFWKVTLPAIFPALVAGALLAFALSIDDFIITSFVAGQYITFPLWVYGAVKTGIPPQVFVMGTVIFAGGVLIALANVFFNRRRLI
jgi:spermidine/putrescine transport system permease protein